MNKAQYIEFLRGRQKQAELYALFHIHSASNGHCLSKNLFHGTGDTQFTNQEKIDDAMETALRHIRHFSEITDKLSSLES